ncbi:unnamed protein product [Caenorhabditis auriculariae]|uniref:Tyrosine-protein kinase n=1 Tax=Caenorhabditis auriculariae TaxID=2777116 RepID=A0A8S1H996_9PELO|nr:unnamed protein product [Caenorhabditis auriculariae]
MFLVRLLTAKPAKKPAAPLPTVTESKPEEHVSVHEVLVPIRKEEKHEQVKVISTIERARKLPFCHGFMPSLEAVNLLVRSGDFLIRLREVKGQVRVVVSVALTSAQSTKLRQINEKEDTRKGCQVAKKVPYEKEDDGDVATDLGETGDDRRKGSDSFSEIRPAPFRETIAVNYRHMKLRENKNGCSLDGEYYFSNLNSLLAFYMFVKLEGPQDFNLRNPISRQYGSFRSSQIKIVKTLGNGAFGEVSLAEINHPAFAQNKAAVKTMKKGVPEHLGLEEKFLVEGTISIPLDHPNVVRTLGWCYDSKPLQLLMELCPGGALSTFLMAKSEKASNLTLTRFCLDAARGLEYLHDVGVLHRDVAARNCLIDEHGTAKVADFGLSVKAYYYEMTTAENLPTRYLPPESLTNYSFNAESDVYAYGHLVCEVFNKCQMPYAGMSGPEARKQILAGKVVNVHERAPEALRFFVENRIFAYHAIYRPTMPQIVEFMTEVISILKEANPGDNAAFEIGAENKEAMQPSTGTEEVFERLEPSSAAQSPPVDVAA